MYKVIVVDDDYPVLEYLATIPWSDLGYSVIGYFQDGYKALEQAKLEIPDVIITDIGMPKMNGIELIRSLKDLNSDIQSIILSCHDEFKYAQQAIKLSTFDYILKESMDAETLIDRVTRLREKLDKENNVNQLTTLSNDSFYLEAGEIDQSGNFEFTTNDIYTLYDEALQEFKSIVMQEDTKQLELVIDKWIVIIRGNRYPPIVVKEWVVKILLDLKLKLNSMQNFELNLPVKVLDHIINKVETIDQLEGILTSILLKMVTYMKEMNKLPKRSEIIKAQKYVAMNVHKKITLGEVAAHLHLNPSYFSRLYKQETGENFIDFVNNTKMERAKEILDSSNKSAEEISEMLGFENKSYFLKTFKKSIGLSPSEYRSVKEIEELNEV